MKKHKSNLLDWGIDNQWTLILDRDGVINQKLDADYVKSIAEFQFIENAEKAIAEFTKLFGYIFIATNQQGIGKGLMTENDLLAIHAKMIRELRLVGGKITKIYAAPHLASEDNPLRKPGIGMGMMIKQDFPDVDFSKSIVVGDSISDMQFGNQLETKTIFIGSSENSPEFCDHCFSSLYKFAESLKSTCLSR